MTLEEWVKEKQLILDRLMIEEPEKYFSIRKIFTEEYKLLQQEEKSNEVKKDSNL